MSVEFLPGTPINPKALLTKVLEERTDELAGVIVIQFTEDADELYVSFSGGLSAAQFALAGLKLQKTAMDFADD